MFKNLLTGLSLFAVAACAAETEQGEDYTAMANRIAAETIIVDGHIDVPYRLADEWDDVSGPTETGDFDYPRAISGGLNAPFMSIYTPATLDGTPEAKAHADRMIDIVERIAAESPNKFAVAKSVADVEAAFFQVVQPETQALWHTVGRAIQERARGGRFRITAHGGDVYRSEPGARRNRG